MGVLCMYVCMYVHVCMYLYYIWIFSCLSLLGVKSGPTAKTVSKPVKPVWTKEDDMARKIQSCFRGYK